MKKKRVHNNLLYFKHNITSRTNGIPFDNQFLRRLASDCHGHIWVGIFVFIECSWSHSSSLTFFFELVEFETKIFLFWRASNCLYNEASYTDVDRSKCTGKLWITYTGFRHFNNGIPTSTRLTYILPRIFDTSDTIWEHYPWECNGPTLVCWWC